MIYVREGCIVKLFDLNKFMEITSELDLIIGKYGFSSDLEKLSAVAVSREFFILGTREGGLRKYNIKMEMQHVYRTKDCNFMNFLSI